MAMCKGAGCSRDPETVDLRRFADAVALLAAVQQMLCVSCDKFVVIQSSADQARSAAEERSSPAVARPSHAAPVEASRGRTGAGAPRPQGPSQGRQSQSVRDIVWRVRARA